MISLLAIPMHGEVKMRREGLRTRDGHLLEWIAKRDDILLEVESRPEPWPRMSFARRGTEVIPPSMHLSTNEVFRLPALANKRRWWVVSSRYFKSNPGDFDVVAIWNIVGGAHLLRSASSEVPVWVDLLDDWTVHPAFRSFRSEVEESYRYLMDRATLVTANSEGTLELACRFGRDDALLIPNGVDPERFKCAGGSKPLGVPTRREIVVGYGGKMGFRLDLPLIGDVVRRTQGAHFRFAGPMMDRSTARFMSKLPNTTILGDVPYSNYPSEVRSWDIGWVPHRIGDGEIGGDVIKIYEYLAASLPTISTPIIGIDRHPQTVIVADRSSFVDEFDALVSAVRLGDVVEPTGFDWSGVSWASKVESILDVLADELA